MSITFNLYRNFDGTLDGRYKQGNKPSSPPATLFVDKSGSDSNDGLSDSSPFLTIQKALDTAVAGDVIEIGAGTYSELYPNTTGLESTVSLKAISSGTQQNPIVLRAKTGQERQVIIDGQNTHIGFHLAGNDYYEIRGIKFQNTRIASIRNFTQVGNTVPNYPSISTGCIVDSCEFDHVTGGVGVNTSHIAMWGSENWVVTNNLINDSTAEGGTLAAGIQAYGVINALIKNNTITNADFGVFWKDHLVQDVGTRTPYFESEISYNKIKTNSHPINIGISGTNSTEAGETYIHNNILECTSANSSGIYHEMSGAFDQSAYVRAEHNTIYSVAAGASAISISASENITLSGNIMAVTNNDIALIRYDTAASNGKFPYLTASDYNVFDSTPQFLVEQFGSGSTTYSSLATWQAITAGQTVAVNNPDTNSTTSTAAILFTDAVTGDFTNKSGSPAIGLMSDGSNAGAYRFGTETIGASF